MEEYGEENGWKAAEDLYNAARANPDKPPKIKDLSAKCRQALQTLPFMQKLAKGRPKGTKDIPTFRKKVVQRSRQSGSASSSPNDTFGRAFDSVNEAQTLEEMSATQREKYDADTLAQLQEVRREREEAWQDQHRPTGTLFYRRPPPGPVMPPAGARQTEWIMEQLQQEQQDRNDL